MPSSAEPASCARSRCTARGSSFRAVRNRLSHQLWARSPLTILRGMNNSTLSELARQQDVRIHWMSSERGGNHTAGAVQRKQRNERPRSPLCHRNASSQTAVEASQQACHHRADMATVWRFPGKAFWSSGQAAPFVLTVIEALCEASIRRSVLLSVSFASVRTQWLDLAHCCSLQPL